MTISLFANGSPQLALMQAGLIRNLRAPDPKTLCDALLNAVAGKVNFSKFVPATNDTPAYYIGDTGIDVVCVIDGMTVFTQALQLVAGYVGGPIDSVTQPDNAYVRSQGEVVANELAASVLDHQRRLCLAGWSLGGCIAEAVTQSNAMSVRGFVSNNVITFGSPRWTGEGVIRGLNGVASNWRIMNVEDIIPQVPPSADAFPVVVVLFGIRGAMRASNFYHSPGGSEMDVNGVFTRAFTTATTSEDFTADFATWLLNKDGASANRHAIGVYIARLTLAVQRQEASGHTRAQQQNGSTVVAARAEPHRPGGRAVIAVAEQRTISIINNLQRQQNQVPVEIPPQFRFRAFRAGRIYYVFFGNARVTVCTNKRSARALARVGNAFLETLQNKPSVDAAGVIQAFQVYLQNAASPTGTFVPVLNTSLPQS